MSEKRTDDIERLLRSATDEEVAERAAAATERTLAAAQADGLVDVAYAEIDSPLGTLLAATTPRGLVRLAYPENEPDLVLETLAQRVSPRVLRAPAELDAVRRELDEYFAGGRRTFDLPIDWTLVAPFGRRVLAATAAIPFGEVRSYGEVAEVAGSPNGSRATGNALGANPVPIVVPCHRVLRSGGALGGYTGGTEKKAVLLRLEGFLSE